jgi:hypothetical protein
MWFSTGVPVPGPQQAAGLGRLAGGILDRLRLVEHDVVELRLAEIDDVAAERAVGRDHDVLIRQAVAGVLAAVSRVVEHPQARGEPPRLLDPVEHEALGDDHQRWP